MAEGIVDLLEKIEVEAANREAIRLAPARRDPGGELVAEKGPIAQSGQRIMMGEVGDLRFGPLALGDVDDRHQLAVASAIGDLSAEGEHLDLAAIGANVPTALVEGAGVAGFAGAPHAISLFAVTDLVARHGEKLLARIAVVRD